MVEHPFIVRIRTERALLKVINETEGLTDRPLAGLSPKTIRRWAAEALDGLPDAARVALVEFLLDASARLRLGSTASHRGSLEGSAPGGIEIEAAEAALRELLSRMLALGVKLPADLV
jgi:hypothetical protein